MEIIGKVTHRLELRQGTSAKGNSWQSQDYVIQYDYDQQYPHSVVLNFFGEKVSEAAQLLHKDTIAKFQFDPEAREITTQAGKKMWMQTLRCYNFTVNNPDLFSTQAPQPSPTPVQGSTSAVPTNQVNGSTSAVPNIPSDPIPQDDTSSLPF